MIVAENGMVIMGGGVGCRQLWVELALVLIDFSVIAGGRDTTRHRERVSVLPLNDHLAEQDDYNRFDRDPERINSLAESLFVLVIANKTRRGRSIIKEDWPVFLIFTLRS